ncbi:MAG: D-alanyl-D-alanine carboxypeptidase family protein [Gallionella sp.]|nr:D-alanyl-D-alanine carboxypeptidase family protein [Gallionella sp.]
MRLLLGLLLSCHALLALGQPDPFPEIASAYRVEVDGRPVWERQANRRLPPASLTKLMTALLVLDDYHPQAEVAINRSAAGETGSRLGLRNGDRFHVEDLLAAALIHSANDACRALAEHIAGSEAHFVQRMNRRARELGMRDTRFTNACGHDAPGHYSSARDLALLANESLKHPALLELTSKQQEKISALNAPRDYRFANKNALIGRYRGALGLKTGYTPKAGKCLIAYAERGSTKVLLVMLHGCDRWWDTVDILDLAFDHARAAP